MYFIGNFQHLSHQQETDESERRHGHFSMMVEAETMDEAMAKFRNRLVSFRSTTSFFEGQCTIFITQLLEFAAFPSNEAVVVNYSSFAGDPVMPYIACVAPDEQNNSCSIHEWDQNHPTTEGRKDSIFLEFN